MKCTKNRDARAKLLFCSLNLLFFDGLVAIAVVASEGSYCRYFCQCLHCHHFDHYLFINSTSSPANSAVSLCSSLPEAFPKRPAKRLRRRGATAVFAGYLTCKNSLYTDVALFFFLIIGERGARERKIFSSFSQPYSLALAVI